MPRKTAKSRLLSRILFGLNLAVILLLLTTSGLLLAFSLSSQPSLLGYRALLEAPSREGGAADSDRLLLYRPMEDAAPPAIGARILLQFGTGEIALGTVRQSDGGILTYETDAGREETVPVGSPELLGKVAVESGFWGHALAVIAAPANVPVAYIIVLILFLFCILVLVLIQLRSAERPPAPAERDPFPEWKRAPAAPEDAFPAANEPAPPPPQEDPIPDIPTSLPEPEPVDTELPPEDPPLPFDPPAETPADPEPPAPDVPAPPDDADDAADEQELLSSIDELLSRFDF